MVFGVSAAPMAALVEVVTPSAAPLVSFQKALVVACELWPSIGIGTCWSCHCTVGCTPTWLIPAMVESEHPDSIMAGISHVGVQPTVQWHDQQVPIPMLGQSSQATTSAFWKDTNGAAEGVTTSTNAAIGAALTPKTIPFTEAYQ